MIAERVLSIDSVGCKFKSFLKNKKLKYFHICCLRFQISADRLLLRDACFAWKSVDAVKYLTPIKFSNEI